MYFISITSKGTAVCNIRTSFTRTILWHKKLDNMTLFSRKFYFIWPNKIFSFFNTFLVLPCCYMLFNKKVLLVQQHTEQWSSSLGAPVNCSKSFLTAFIFVALDNFTFGIVVSVSSFTKWQFTHSFVKRIRTRYRSGTKCYMMSCTRLSQVLAKE